MFSLQVNHLLLLPENAMFSDMNLQLNIKYTYVF